MGEGSELEALLDAPLNAQIDALASAQVSSEQLTAGYLERIEQRNPALGAYLAIDGDRALAAARESDKRRQDNRAVHPLDGIAFAVKDNIDAAGLPTTAGMATRRDRVATADATCVARLRHTGAVLLGKLHLHEAALGADGNNPHYPRCHHPQRRDYTPGGSSGGSAAAVAAGLCSFALGSDSMGSVRIPASYCGVVGFKPSFARVSQRGLVRVSRRLDHIGPLTRSAADLPGLFQAISGIDRHDPNSRSVPLAHAEVHGRRLRIAHLDNLAAHGVESEVSAAFDAAVAQIGQAIGQTSPVRIEDYDFARTRRAGLLLCEAEMLIEHADDWQQQRDQFSPRLRAMLEFAAGRSASNLIKADRALDDAVLMLRGILGEHDVLLTPTTPQPAFHFDSPVPDNQADLTSIANFAGVPAISVPMGHTADGLPLGLQAIGPVGSDLLLMALAERFERLRNGA